VDSFKFTSLGQTGIQVGRLGVAASYGAPAEAFEAAFEKGCNYFYWGSMRKSGMKQAIANICRIGKREELVIVLQSYSRSPFLMQFFLKMALKSLNIASADVLLLGWHNRRPSQKILDKCMAMKDKGLYRFLGISSHKRSLFPQMAKEEIFDIFHIRYNAAHRGAETEVFGKLNPATKPGIVSYTATRWGQLLNPKKSPPGEPPLSAGDCYRFALSNPAVDICMCGPRNRNQMKQALQSLDSGQLGEDELARIKKIGDYVHEHSTKFF
jgi:aryl-alcohol dehydrogenase-like predicted oxidoreductase